MNDEEEQTTDDGGGDPDPVPLRLTPQPAADSRSVAHVGRLIRPRARPLRVSRVSVVDEPPPRPAPPDGAAADEYKWHTYKVYPSGQPDAVEFVDTYKSSAARPSCGG